ncbi:MAG: phosphotransferase family protein [Candidatus Bathyarchaeota archaeon]|nr:phosphotransferase family protein [Candidatus Bathyarchaeota archaeon]
MNNIAKSLAEYYNLHYPDRVNQTVSEVEDITSGWEAELYSFVVEHEEGGRTLREERVARVYQGNVATQKAVEEFKVISGLAGAGFPVPEVFHLETDATLLGGPFIIMERVRGRSLSEAYHASDEEEARSLMAEFTRIWVDLHNLDGASLFPEDFPRGDTQDYLDELLVIANRRIEETGIGWLRPVIDWLEERRSGVTPERLSILHQDYHTENVLLRDDGRLVVLDWTAAMAGDYRADLAWTVLLMSTYDDPAFRDMILESYEEASGREIRDIEFFDVLAIGRRILDVSSSFAAGAEQVGLRAGALEMMRESSDHLHKVYELLKERTGLRLPEFEELLDSL